jgi:hypothetical protein
MTSPEELLEALDEVETIVWATCEWGSLGREKMNVLVNLFSAFKVEYDGQLHVPRFSICMSSEDYDRMVHVPRKQLSEHLATFPFQSKDCPNEIKHYWCKNEYTTCFQYYHCEWFKTLKELVETSEHHFLTVSEAREKLKEVSKEAKP